MMGSRLAGFVELGVCSAGGALLGPARDGELESALRPATIFPAEGRRLWTAAACCRFYTRSLLRDLGIEHDD